MNEKLLKLKERIKETARNRMITEIEEMNINEEIEEEEYSISGRGRKASKSKHSSVKIEHQVKRQEENNLKNLENPNNYSIVKKQYVIKINENDFQEDRLLLKKLPPPRPAPQLQPWPVEQPDPPNLQPSVPQVPEQVEIQEQDIEGEINCMMQQKEQNLQEDPQNQEALRELIVNTIRNKKKTKPKKRWNDLPTPFEQMSQPYQLVKIFAEYQFQYKKRREKTFINGNLVIDLGVKYLHQVVALCLLEDILPKKLKRCFKYQKVENELEFISLFAGNKLQEFNFESILFTSLDHRRLCNMLLLKDPKKYTMGERVFVVFKEIADFYEQIYKMDEVEYYNLHSVMGMKYRLFWWKEIDSSFDEMGNNTDHFDTSTYFQPKPSPLFGADINDPQNDFEKAKKRLYPNREVKKLQKGKKKIEPSISEQSESSSDEQDSQQQYLDGRQGSDENQSQSEASNSQNSLPKIKSKSKNKNRNKNKNQKRRRQRENSSSDAQSFANIWDEEQSDHQDQANKNQKAEKKKEKGVLQKENKNKKRSKQNKKKSKTPAKVQQSQEMSIQKQGNGQESVSQVKSQTQAKGSDIHISQPSEIQSSSAQISGLSSLGVSDFAISYNKIEKARPNKKQAKKSEVKKPEAKKPEVKKSEANKGNSKKRKR